MNRPLTPAEDAMGAVIFILGACAATGFLLGIMLLPHYIRARRFNRRFRKKRILAIAWQEPLLHLARFLGTLLVGVMMFGSINPFEFTFVRGAAIIGLIFLVTGVLAHYGVFGR